MKWKGRILPIIFIPLLLGFGYWCFFIIVTNPKSSDNLAINSENKLNSHQWKDRNQSITQRISFGEKILISNDVLPDKKDAAKAILDQNYQQAITNLTSSLKIKPNDPEALIYLHNARIGSGKSYTLVVSTPIGNDPNTALEILRGVAQAQNEINTAGGVKGVPLKVGIANDENNPKVCEQIAAALVANPAVLGVVGHYSSDATLAAGKVYNDGKLVAISPTSSSVKISNFSPYVFRTLPSDFVAARALANYMVKTLGKKNAAVFYNSQSNYSQSLKSEFIASVSLEGRQISGEFDLSKADFSPSSSIEKAFKQGAEVLMLAPNSETLDKGLQVVQLNQKRLILLGGDTVYSLKTLDITREQALSMVVAVPWHINGNPNSPFPAQSRKLWGSDVNWRTATAYDATKAFIAALATNPSRSGIQKTLLSSDFSTNGAAGSIRFLPSGDRNTPVQLVKIVRGNRSGTGYDFEPVLEK